MKSAKVPDQLRAGLYEGNFDYRSITTAERSSGEMAFVVNRTGDIKAFLIGSTGVPFEGTLRTRLDRRKAVSPSLAALGTTLSDGRGFLATVHRLELEWPGAAVNAMPLTTVRVQPLGLPAKPVAGTFRGFAYSIPAGPLDLTRFERATAVVNAAGQVEVTLGTSDRFIAAYDADGLGVGTLTRSGASTERLRSFTVPFETSLQMQVLDVDGAKGRLVLNLRKDS